MLCVLGIALVYLIDVHNNAPLQKYRLNKVTSKGLKYLCINIYTYWFCYSI